MRANVLFVHNNFPAQFGFVATALKKEGARCAAISSSTGRDHDGIPLRRYSSHVPRGLTAESIWRRAATDMARGRSAAEAALELRTEGFEPDIIVGHTGWGETIFLREVFPRARQILYAEYYYRTQGGDVGFDPEFGSPSFDERLRVQAKNATLALALGEADRIVAPTAFQASLLPEAFRSRAIILHEGVDTARVRPDPQAELKLPHGGMLDRSTPIITFVNRRLEPLRGYHIFLRALPRVLAELPTAQVVIIGNDTPGGYGRGAPAGTSWREHFWSEVSSRIDQRRVHFVGRLPYPEYLRALQISSCHVYYTYPFVASWSLLEAMAAGCLLLASDTAPVRDFIEDGQNGFLSNFFDHRMLADRMMRACKEPEKFLPIREAARQTIVDRFDRNRHSGPAWTRLVRETIARSEGR